VTETCDARVALLYSEVTTHCQNRCSMCVGGMEEKVDRPPFVDQETMDAVVQLLHANPDCTFWFYPHVAGEPLLFKGLDAYLKRVCALPNTRVWLCTNGVLLNDARLTELKNIGLRRVWFSMFETGEEEYARRTRTDHYPTAKANLLNLLDRHAEFDNIHVVSFSDDWRGFEITAPNITYQASRPLYKWDPVYGGGKSICVATDGRVTYTWGDYKFEHMVGNIKTLSPQQLVEDHIRWDVEDRFKWGK